MYHASGLAGRGNSSYIDSVILRDRDINSTDAADWDNLYTEASSNAAIPVDFDFDGAAFDPADNDAFYAAYSEASEWSNGGAGGGRLSRIGNRKGYAGYEFDRSIEAYHVRHRVYIPELGRWTKRDPIGYVDGMGLYQYVNGNVIRLIDTFGLLGNTPGRICNNTTQTLLIWTDHDGFRVLQPGECSGDENDGDTGDYWYIPGTGWVKCPGNWNPLGDPTLCSPTDKNPNDGRPVIHPLDPDRWNPSGEGESKRACDKVCSIRIAQAASSATTTHYVMGISAQADDDPAGFGEYCKCMSFCTGVAPEGCDPILPPPPPPPRVRPIDGPRRPGEF